LTTCIPATGENLVEVWEHYNVTLTVHHDGTQVTEELTIRNIIDKTIVPGYGYITLSTESPSRIFGLPLPFTGNTQAMQISDISVKLDDGTIINDIEVSTTENETTIKYGFWIPVMPGESRTITIDYITDDIVKNGLIFDQISYSIQPSSIPIENARIEADVNGKHVSYSNYPFLKTDDTTVWTNNDIDADTWELELEYGSLPLPNMSLKWSLIFLLIIFGVICIWSYSQWKYNK
jgi:hypothetical protein